jgi:Alginate lyase
VTHITSRDVSDIEHRPGAGGAGAWLVLLATACTVAVAWAVHYFPYHDATNNLARYVLMDRAWFGHPASFVRVRLLPTPYIGLDLIGVLFVHFFGPGTALRLMATLLICIIPLGLWRLVSATCPARRGWALVGVQCSLSFYFLFGFFNFVAGIGAALLWLAVWWPRRDTESWATRVWLSLGLALVFLVHLAGAMTVLVVLGVAMLVSAWRSWTADGRISWAGINSPRLAMLASACVAVGLFSVVWHLSLGYEAPASVPPWFRPLGSKVSNLASPFYSLSKAQMVVMAGGYLASLATFLAVNRRALRVDALVVSAAAFVVLYLVFPYSVDGAGFVDIRWMLPAILMPFAATAAGSVPVQRVWLVVPFTMAIAHAGLVLVEGKHLDRNLEAYRRVLQAVPPEARLLPLVADGKRHGRLDPYRHFAMWHTIDDGGRVVGLLVEEEQFDTNPPRLLHKFFGHFQEPVHLYYPDEHWGTDSMSVLDWHSITRDFDYIVVAGDNPAARGAIADHADSVAGDGDVVLYRLRAARVARQGVLAAGMFAAAVVAPMRAAATPVSFASLRVPAEPAPARLAAYPHPGGFYTQAQIDYVKKQIAAHAEPWSSAYTRLMNSVAAKKNTQPNVPAVFNVPGYYEDKAAFFASTHEMTTDADAAYMMALAYQLNGDQNLADRSARILGAWAHTNTGISGHDGQLTMAYMGVGLVLAGELLGNYPGWAAGDRAAFQNWVRTVYIAQGAGAIQDRTNNWGEWGTFGVIAADHFLDDADGLAAETGKLEHHIDQAIAADGSMPDETSRGQAGIWYTFFSLAPMTAAARVVENSGGPNLFTWTSPSGRRMDTAITYLFNALQQPSSWTFAQNATVPNGPRDDWAYDMFEAMSDQFNNPQYAAYAAQRRPIMTSGHHYAWTFSTLMKAPAGM